MERLRKKPKGDEKPNLHVHMDHIPYVVAFLIFCNLPVKTLCQLKCVCKQWHSWISDPEYRFPGKGRGRAILYSRKRNPYGRVQFFSLCHELDRQEIPEPHPVIEQLSDIETFKFLGSCNGLLLTQDRDATSWNSRFYSWNPTTRSCTHLSCLDGLNRNVAASGLCFDESTDDYKVALMLSNTLVKVPHAQSKYINQFTDVSFQIASLRKRTVAKRYRIPCNIVCATFKTQLGVSTNGHLHWIVKAVNGVYLIVYFDQKNNRLNKLPMPGKVMDSNSIYELGVVDGRLCIFAYEFHRKSQQCSVSLSQKVIIMREYGVKESWSTTLLYNPLKASLPRRLTTFGEKIFMSGKGRVVSAYNVKDMTKRDIFPSRFQLFDLARFELLPSQSGS